MGVIQDVFHDPFVQANIGLYPSPGIQPKFSPIGPLSFGFLWGSPWSNCGLTSGATWSACGLTSAVSWSDCGLTSIATWISCD